MNTIDMRKTMVNIKHVEPIGDDESCVVYITGLVLPHFKNKDPRVTRAFDCIGHAKDIKTGRYVLWLKVSDPEPTKIMVSTWAKDFALFQDV
jgi:hypothetical protein